MKCWTFFVLTLLCISCGSEEKEVVPTVEPRMTPEPGPTPTSPVEVKLSDSMRNCFTKIVASTNEPAASRTALAAGFRMATQCKSTEQQASNFVNERK